MLIQISNKATKEEKLFHLNAIMNCIKNEDEMADIVRLTNKEGRQQIGIYISTDPFEGHNI